MTPKHVGSIEEEWVQGVQLMDLGEEFETDHEWRTRLKELYLKNLPYVRGFSATPWVKIFNDLAHNVITLDAASEPRWNHELRPDSLVTLHRGPSTRSG